MATFCAVPPKKTNDVDMVKPMRKFIENTYSNIQKEDYDTAISEFNKLRGLMTQKSMDKHESALETLYRYYDQLSEIEKKLPISAHQIPLNFKWRDAFDVDSFLSSKRTMAMMSGGYEKMCVFFNIGAVQSQVAAAQNHDSDEGRKVAAKYFQMASGVFSEMREVVMAHLQQDPTPDMSTDALSALSILMVAQAQENIYTKAFADKMKEASVAKLAYQCSEFYAEAMKLMQISTVNLLWPRDWINIVAMKQAALHSLAEFNQSVVAQKAKAYGEEIARLKKADSLMKTAINHGGSSFCYRNEHGRIQRALEKGTKDNDFIYHDRVPESSDLAPIGKLPVAKPIAPTKPMSSGFTDLFNKLVPLEVHYALTAFDNRKSTVINMEVGRMREATQLMNSILASLNLPAALEDITGTNVPESLMEKAQKVKSEGGIDNLNRLLHDIPSLLTRNREILDEACKQLREEEQSDTSLRQQFGDKWKRTPSTNLTQPMNEEAAKYRSILDQAVSADKQVNEKYDKHRGVIEILSKPQAEVQTAVPSANPGAALQNSPVFADLKRMMGEVDAIRAEREATEAELNDATFNMASVFMSALASDGAIDEERISTDELNGVYTKLRERISESLRRQEALLQNIQTANTEFCHAKQSNSAASTREMALKDLAAGYDMFVELKKHLEEGTKFYNDLTPLLVKHQTKVADFCFARKTEKDELMADLQKSIANQPSQAPPQAPNYQSTSQSASVPPARPPPPNIMPTAHTSSESLTTSKPVAAPRNRHSPAPQGSAQPQPAAPQHQDPTAPAASAPLPYPTQAPGAGMYYPPSQPVPMPMPTAYNPYMNYNQPPAPYGQPPPQGQQPYPQYPTYNMPYPTQQPYPGQPYPGQPYPGQQYPQQYPNYNTQQWR